MQGCNVPLALEIFAKFAKFSSMRFLDLSSWVPGGQFCLQSSPVIENLDRLLPWLVQFAVWRAAKESCHLGFCQGCKIQFDAFFGSQFLGASVASFAAEQPCH